LIETGSINAEIARKIQESIGEIENGLTRMLDEISERIANK
jgi:hypothetical protein